mmetsp:Transcript_17507/g.26064  ORF Transcript_17507/g.26064 Transcript_17507/m.26064 type:complete len:136 (-) Transcript_17507:553-960(-)
MEALTMEEMMEGKEVIDWDEAMEQCGDDEIFLRELLADLRVEVGTQLAKMEEILKNPPNDGTFHQIMRASHVIKGAASNLMCKQLRHFATQLEHAAAVGQDSSVDAAALDNVKHRFYVLTVAMSNYRAFLDSIGV